MNMVNAFKESYVGSHLREIKHRLIYKKQYNRMIQAMERYEKCDNKKPIIEIKKEINLCKKFWGCYPLHYYRYDLYKKDKQLSEKELLNYIPEFFFYNLFLPFYDSNKYEMLIEEKNITEQIFRSLNIKQPDTIFKLTNNDIYGADLEKKGFEQIKIELLQNEYKKIFVKPVDGQGGYGIYIFHRDGKGNYVTKDNIELNNKFLNKISEKRDYIVQKGLEQDERISEIYPNSINTFRITTENKKGKVRVVCSVLRIGKGNSELDNCSQDGISLKVDVQSGKSGDYATTETGEKFYKHPDTDFIFKGYLIPDWDKIKNFVIISAEKLPQFTYLGWDIALTKEGPLAIETNLGFGLDLYQVSLGGLREAFGIENPKFYWKNRGERS